MSESDRRRDPLFDPMGMWRLFSDVQRLGFETAANVAERFGAMADRDLGADAGQAGAARDSGEPATTFGADAEKMVDAYFDLMQVSWDVFGSFVRASVAAWSGAVGGNQVRLSDARPGEKARGAIHLHNSADKDVEGAKVEISDLVGASGVIDSDAATIDPRKVSIAAGQSASVAVVVAVPDDAGPGLYTGVASAPFEPRAEVAVTLRVLPGDS